jgi:hypothetical protein
MILPIGSKSNKFRKWSPNWEGPYRIKKVIPKNYYMVQSMQVTSLPRALNEKCLERHMSWKSADNKIICLTIKMADETSWTSSLC